MAKLNLAVIVGSNRRDSINRKLAHALARLGAASFEASFPRIDDLPMFNQDLEASLPAEVLRYKDEVSAADGALIVTPEHDRSIPALLKTRFNANEILTSLMLVYIAHVDGYYVKEGRPTSEASLIRRAA